MTTKPQLIQAHLLVADITDFTGLVYQASRHQIRKPKAINTVINGVHEFFHNALSATDHHKHVRIINTTGDGLIATISGLPKDAVEFALMIRKQFHKHAKIRMGSVEFRHNIDLRVALHHGIIYRIEIRTPHGTSYTVYIGDDLNLVARVIGSRTARDNPIAVTRAFYDRLPPRPPTSPPLIPEVLHDKNMYPEDIEIFPLS